MKVGGSSIAEINVDIVGGVPEDLVAKVEEKEAAIKDGGFETPVDESAPAKSIAVASSDGAADERRAGRPAARALRHHQALRRPGGQRGRLADGRPR